MGTGRKGGRERHEGVGRDGRRGREDEGEGRQGEGGSGRRGEDREGEGGGSTWIFVPGHRVPGYATAAAVS